jgi:hypothetical protein
MPYYTQLINICKQMNYMEFQTPEFNKYEADLNKIVEERRAK